MPSARRSGSPRRRARWGPRRSLALALLLSAAVGVGIELYGFYNWKSGDKPRLAAAIGAVLAALAVARWLPAIVSFAGPGRRLLAALAVDIFVVGLGFAIFAGGRTSLAYAVAATGVAFGGVAAFWWVPRLQASHWPRDLTSKECVELEDKARSTVAQLLSGIGLIATVAITLYSVNQSRVAADRTLRTSQREQDSSRFSRAIDQLGARVAGQPVTEIRLGAIYSLEQYAIETTFASDKEAIAARATTATLLAAYIRTNSPFRPKLLEEKPPPRPRGCTDSPTLSGRRPAVLQPDILASVEILQRLYAEARFDRIQGIAAATMPRVDLSHSDLRGADLSNMDLHDATLAISDIAGADLSVSDLGHADLTGVDGRNACLLHATLFSATIRGARFDGAVKCAGGKYSTGPPEEPWKQLGAVCPP